MSGIDRFPKKPCKFCKQTTHFSYRCYANPKVAMRRKYGMKRTPIKKMGKHAKQWFITRATWIRKNPPDRDGYWYCYLQIHEWCPVKLTISTLTLDHVVSRSSDPKLRYNQDNLRPACTYCNDAKGSRSLEAVFKSLAKGLKAV